MRITESKLRRIIRQVIRESVGSEEEVLKDLEADTGVFDIDSALDYLRSGGRTNESFYRRRRMFESSMPKANEIKRKLPEIEKELVKHTGHLSEEEREELARKLEEAQREVDYLKRREKIEEICGLTGITIAAVPVLIIIASVFFGSDIGRQVGEALGPFGTAAAAVTCMFGGMMTALGFDGRDGPDTRPRLARAEKRLNRLKRNNR